MKNFLWTKLKKKTQEMGGHLPFELFLPFILFVVFDSENVVLSKVSGSRKLENGLVPPATLFVKTERKKIFQNLKIKIY